ncbi:MAG: hypothetical protein A2W00_12500 [Candidatus Eisenbacteria bacterium RBG_16_71_46]|nr:MAG: hypothetical protein A2W00_12500 [Candidatus Eisenbacteria bacterium RBG_16_71_46]
MVLSAVMALELALAPQAAVAPAVADTAATAGGRPDSVRLVRLEEELASTRRIRVSFTGRTVELERPVLAEAGVRFARAKGFPAPRPALVTAAAWDTVPPPPNPVRWSSIERIERPEKRWGPGGVIGGGLGLWGGLTLGVVAGWIVGYTTNSQLAGWTTFAGVGLGGAVLGSYAMGRYSEWVEIYPAHAGGGAGSDPARASARRP